jgi:hypothetical protein
MALTQQIGRNWARSEQCLRGLAREDLARLGGSCDEERTDLDRVRPDVVADRLPQKSALGEPQVGSAGAADTPGTLSSRARNFSRKTSGPVPDWAKRFIGWRKATANDDLELFAHGLIAEVVDLGVEQRRLVIRDHARTLHMGVRRRQPKDD